MHRRRGSTLKTVMRRIFGRTRRRSLAEDDEEHAVDESQITVESGKPMSDLGPEGGTFVTMPDSLRSNRSPSLTYKEASQANGLHALGDQDIESARRQPRRRATLPSLVLSDEEGRNIVTTMIHNGTAVVGTGMSSETRRSVEDRRQKSIIQAKRRSRSASALREAARGHRMSPIQWRRRSDEIRFWRTSVLEEPSTRPQTDTTVASEKEVGPTDVPESIAETEAESAAFNFANVLEMQKDESVTLEQRVTTLEVKLMDLELAIAKLQDSKAFQTDKSRRKRSPSRERLAPHERGLPSGSFPSGDSEHSPRSSPSVVDGPRPHSTSTLRPNTLQHMPTWRTPSSTSLPDINGISIEQYSALVTLVRREQSARKMLENQVSQLQEDIRQLQRVILRSMASGNPYSLPSPDSHEVMRFRRAVGSLLMPRASRTEETHADYLDTDTDSVRSDIYVGEDTEHRSHMDLVQRNHISGMI